MPESVLPGVVQS